MRKDSTLAQESMDWSRRQRQKKALMPSVARDIAVHDKEKERYSLQWARAMEPRASTCRIM
jgi:hypothetical protein